MNKMNMRKGRLTITLLLLLTLLASACGAKGQGGGEDDAAAGPDAQGDVAGRINIVTTIFPQYDWARQIIGEANMDRFNLSYLLESGIDTHSYNPSISDMIRIKTSDIFMYVGGHSDGWVDDVLGAADVNPGMVTMDLLEVLGDQPLLEAFCDDEDEDHDHGEDEFQIDEHVWLSLKYAQLVCAAIADALSEADPENAQAYMGNMEAYAAQLAALDAKYQAAVDGANVKTMVFADRFPFRYLLDDYGIAHYAAFQGCAAEAEASFVTIISLANRLDQLDLNVVMVTETSDQSIARAVINSASSADKRILTLDAMQAVTPRDVQNGATYLSIMESNLEALEEALGN